ncbi:phosphoribosylaminoimidazolesuccinocarboxamide synthase [Candidatus Roizmanbacteria bacterium RIFCSPHIGHO2_12_FULL_42_10]|uniref:Phosphoribosylaminoimidazole-succinocarboxamide synthase n=2 Tax=Candidatus Roizmaniibacteriota TaxID=1752723 RepID=A0A1F7I4V0_9BACT|nr:MAG: phosphoribosylaminoimidazolesuccinocarboxamide synthase [Candidatus Roizmanbacteria bacterium RIFCSPHIGHO2_02_FULL_39_9]OGK38272.1 MAG: phosphoribosylaminoimidazolesuccinocarboxamide synthase [Candidatus Roizmanbacteria bacterium RIFCSPHIGHO2_12_FULL_42_10]
MIQKKAILKALPHVLKTINIPHLGKKHQGKVRDFYLRDGYRILITTDRQSAFNYHLGYIPFKGSVLNLLSAFWFKKAKKIVDNHLISVPHPNVTIAKNCKPIPVELVVRGYMTGVTVTSIWYSYLRGERVIYGQKFPDGLRKNQQLPKPIITPTTHPDPESGSHDDERLTRDEIIDKGIVNEKLYRKMEKAALGLFALGTKICRRAGLILVDTKYEFGISEGKLIQIDEMHTPDSSRFWLANTYFERFKKGLEPENFDKEFLRLWYVNKLGYKGTGVPPKPPEDLQVKLSQRYIAVYEKITGKKFKPYQYPIEKNIKKQL